MQNEKTVAELRYLKSQVNPHFLFNTLNNLYYLCLKKDDVAPEMVMKLSDLMRYVVSVGEKEFVALEDELNHIESYIDLEKMRLLKPNMITAKMLVQNENAKIVPLLLLPFIENAFKHSRDRIEDGISITISENNYVLHFHISNTYRKNLNNKRQGTGLDNVRRRLELAYPSNYQLQIVDENDIYTVDLKIILHAN